MPPREGSESARQKRCHRQRWTGWRRVVFPGAAILLALLPFVFLEVALRVCDVGSNDAEEAAGFDGSRLFELDEDGAVYSTARHRLLYFGPQTFAREKPEGTFRVFGLGGSTVLGRPYANGSSFVKWLEIELAGRDPSRKYEGVNCGGESYASYRLAIMLQEVLGYDPDLIVVATGHNEFLEDRTYHREKSRSAFVRWAVGKGNRLRTVRFARQLLRGNADESGALADRPDLEPEVDARLDDQSGYASYHRDEKWRQDVIDEYDESVREMVGACRAAGVPLILVNLGENLRDCPPFKSEHRAELSAESLQEWQDLFDGAEAMEDSDLEAAIELYRKAEAIDGEYALLAFRMARCYDRLGDKDRARRYYGKSRQLDICPLRMVNELHERLKRIARETDVPLVDAEALAIDKSPEGIPGNNCFMDHVHPDIGSHQEIGRLLADQVEAMGLAKAGGAWTEVQRRRAYRNQFRRLGPAYLANGRRRVGWLENWARRERLDAEAKPKDARGHLHLGKRYLDFGEVDQAWEQFLLAVNVEPKRIEEILGYAFDLFCQGRPGLAEQVLVRLHREPAAESYRPVIELAFAITAIDAGDTERAQVMASRYGDSLKTAVTDPKLGRWVTVLPELGEQLETLLADHSESPEVDPAADPFAAPAATAPAPSTDEAKRLKVTELLDRAIAGNPESALLYLGRARIRFSKQAYEEALADATRCLELAPENTEALKLRALLYMIQDDCQAAANDLTTAIDLDAGAAELFRIRAAAYLRMGDDAKADADLEAAEKLSAGGGNSADHEDGPM